MEAQKYAFPVFWAGLIIATYLGFGEYYLILVFGLVVFLAYHENKLYISKKRLKESCWHFFVGYYVLISVFGLIAGYTGLKNFIELVLKYICLPVIVIFLFPKTPKKIKDMLYCIKNLIFICAVYGLAESLLKYNYMVDLVRLESRSFMQAMNLSMNYQPCSFFLHYNYYGGVLLIGFLLAVLIPYKNRMLNIFYLLLTVEQVLVCQSRINWVALLIVVAILVFLSGKVTDRRLQAVLLIGVLGVCVIILEPSIPAKLISFVENRFSRLWIYGLEDGSLGQRVGTFLNWFRYIKVNPVAGIFGTGYQSINTVFMGEYSFFEGFSTADCEFTVYLVETGITGVLILIFSARTFFKMNECSGRDNKRMQKMGKLGVVVYLVLCLTLDIASNNIMLTMLYFMIVLGTVITRYETQITENGLGE